MATTVSPLVQHTLLTDERDWKSNVMTMDAYSTNMKFKIQGRMSAKSSLLKPISVEQQEDKSSDVSSKGKSKIKSSGTVHEEQISMIGTLEQQEDKSSDVSSKRKSNIESSGTVHEEQESMIGTDNLPSNPLRMGLWINKDGGVLELPDTGVSLEIPPGALEKDQLIQMRIIPYNFHGDSDLSFSNNSSVVVELLPSNLKLLKPVKLTLPHCLVLKKGCEWKAKIYTSHHEEGTQPLWRPQPDTPYVLTERSCVINLTHFSWEKFDIGDEIVEGKRIVLYAAKHLSSSESITFIDVGYYLELPGAAENVSMDRVSVLVKQFAIFFKEGRLPLKIQFVKTEPPAWACGSEEENTKEIPFVRVATSIGSYYTFVLHIKEGTQESSKCICYFIAGQESDLVDLHFFLQLNYPWLKGTLTVLLSKNDCHQLARHVALPKYQLDAIINSDSSAKDLLDILEERGVIHPFNVSRLLEAIKILKINQTALFMLERYQRSRGDETSYGRFLAGLSSHLTLSLPRKLCDYFEFTYEKKKAVITSQTPGISFLLTLEDMGAINPLDVGKLVTPLKQYQLVQAVAKVQEYQTLVDERSELKKPINTLEGKQALFIECLRKKTKSWYETMTPLPWKKSCKWMTSELFIACGLVLTNSKAKMKTTNVDSKCKLQYTDILTHERLKSATRIIIEGDPGSGKTMLSSQLAYDWSIGKSIDAKMVVFLPLKSVDGMTIIEAIKQFYIPKGKLLNEDDIEAILDQASDEKKTCIVLDGLEEYNGRTKDGEPSEIVRVMRKEKFPNCTVVLTSRSDFVHGLPQCPMLKLGRFGEDERDQYIANIIPEDPQKQQKVKRNIETFALLNDLCSIPLLFVYIVHNIEHLGQIDKPKGQLDSVGPFMEVMVNTLLSLTRSEGSESEIMSTRLSEIAFNGLCKGYQQLMWPKSFLDENVSNVKDWIESGILVVEEGEPTREKEHQKKGEAVDEGMVTKKEIISLDDERRQGESSSEAAMIEESSTDNKPRETEKPFTERKTSTDPQNLSLQVKFLHKVIQEWFAAKHFSSMLQRSKGQNRHRLFLDRQLPLINSADLHYVLRFTSYLCPENCYLIMEHLHSCYKSSMGVVPEYILNCIFLCFIECKSSVGKKKMENAVRQVCENIVTIRGEDSRLLQQSKVSMLTYASKSEIRIGTLRLVDLVVEVTKATITFNSDITLECFPTLKVIEVSRWDMRLKEEDFEELIKFITQCKLLDKAFLSFPSPPPLLTDKKVLSSMKKNLTIEWIIGDKIVHTLDKKSGDWPMQFRSTPHQITDFSQPGPSKSSAHSGKRKKAKERTLTPKSGQKQDTEEPGSITTKKKHVNTGSQKIVQTPQITKAPQILTQGETAYQVMSKSLRAMLMINKEGGRLDIPDTGVSLEIPSGALEGEQFIRMIIIPPHLESESLTFASNSSLVVELLPSNLHLLKPAILTLPHCLVLKKGCEWKAKIYRSHHKEGSEPQWEEQSNTHYKLGEHNCVIEIQRFSWEKIEILDKIVEAKNIVVYAAGRRGLTDSMLLDIGYYLDLATCKELTKRNNASLLHEQPTVFIKDAKPLTILLDKFEPMTWTCSTGNNPQVISFEKVAISKGTFCTFVLRKTEPQETDTCMCQFKAGQAPNLEDYTFLLKAPDPSSVKQPSTSNRHEDERVGTSTAGIEAPELVVTTATIQDMSHKFCDEWRIVGSKLGIGEPKLQTIDIDNRTAQEKVYQMLLTWKQSKGNEATYRLLGEALQSAGRKDLQENLYQQDLTDQQIKIKHKNEDRERSSSKYHVEQTKTERKRWSVGRGRGQGTSIMKSGERATVRRGRGRSTSIIN